jgi:hypothetical protein
MSREEGIADTYLVNSLSTVPSERDMLARPNNSSILLSSPRFIEKPGKTDDCLSVDNLRGVAGVGPRKAAEEVVPEVCLPRYSDIFGDDSGLSSQITRNYSQGAKLTLERT